MNGKRKQTDLMFQDYLESMYGEEELPEHQGCEECTHPLHECDCKVTECSPKLAEQILFSSPNTKGKGILKQVIGNHEK